jgi:hypothetical protein
MTHWLYTTMRPDQLLEVDDAEHADLAAQHLILAEVDPATGEVVGGALHMPSAAATTLPTAALSHVPTALDAAETLADDQPADRPTRSGG